MEYAALFEFLVKQACGVYQIDPAEINWNIGGSGAGSIQFMGSPEQKQNASQQKGLRPLLTFLANQLNTHVVQKIDESLHLEFPDVGLSRVDDAALREKEVRTTRTINEQRKELGWDPIPGGDIILDPIYFQARQAEDQKKAQEQQQLMMPPGGGRKMLGSEGQAGMSSLTKDFVGIDAAE